MRHRLALPVIVLVSTLVVLSVGFLLLGRQREIQRGHDVSALPTLNAFLNGTSAVLLTVGYVFIRLKEVTAHKVWERKITISSGHMKLTAESEAEREPQSQPPWPAHLMHPLTAGCL